MNKEDIKTLAIVLFFAWVLFTILFWLLPGVGNKPTTLLKVLISEWDFITALRLW